ncbi:MAG: zinc ribbon domain-containing protein [Nitrososphaerales archaeon]
MFCEHCGKQINDDAKFCPACGHEIGSALVAAVSPAVTDSELLKVNQLVMTHNSLGFQLNFSFEDSSGAQLGKTQGKIKFPLYYELFDTSGQKVLIVDGEIHGLMRVTFFVRDSSGNILVSMVPKSGFGRKYSVTSGGSEVMKFSSGMSGSQLKLEDSATGSLLASGNSEFSIRTPKTDIEIEDSSIDHRIVLGLMLIGVYSTLKNS